MFALRASWQGCFPTRRFTRGFASISIHTRFPATLYRLQPVSRSNLVAPDPKGAGFPNDEVEISQNGTVKIRSSPGEPVFNGAQFMPNTLAMQEIYRHASDAYMDEDEECRPVIIRILKDTTIPESLLLLQQNSFFALQCSHAQALQELNQELDEFYQSYATIFSARDWFRSNHFVDATGDTDTSRWMSQ